MGVSPASRSGFWANNRLHPVLLSPTVRFLCRPLAPLPAPLAFPQACRQGIPKENRNPRSRFTDRRAPAVCLGRGDPPPTRYRRTACSFATAPRVQRQDPLWGTLGVRGIRGTEWTSELRDGSAQGSGLTRIFYNGNIATW